MGRRVRESTDDNPTLARAADDGPLLSVAGARGRSRATHHPRAHASARLGPLIAGLHRVHTTYLRPAVVGRSGAATVCRRSRRRVKFSVKRILHPARAARLCTRAGWRCGHAPRPNCSCASMADARARTYGCDSDAAPSAGLHAGADAAGPARACRARAASSFRDESAARSAAFCGKSCGIEKTELI